MVTGFDFSHPTIRWLREIEERACREADAVVAVDTAHAEYVRSFGRTERLWTITNFVDTEIYHDRVAAQSFAPEVEAWIAGRPVVFCPRRLVPKNGVDVAVRAFARLQELGPPCVLVVAGYGPQRGEIEALIRELGVANVVWLLGEVQADRMPGWYRRASVVIVPSVSTRGVEEATSISAIEGQACARPVIASSLGGLREILVDGVTGIAVPPGDPEALALAIERVLRDPALADRIARGGAAIVRDERSSEAAAQKFAAIYDEIVSRRS
jgi:glycosyltransferase involved in cell wall biosynthesis